MAAAQSHAAACANCTGHLQQNPFTASVAALHPLRSPSATCRNTGRHSCHSRCANSSTSCSITAAQPAQPQQHNHAALQASIRCVHSSQYGSHRSWLARAPAAAGKVSAEQQVAADLPESREQSIQQASEALEAQLPKEKKGKAGRIGSMKKLAIDVPVADQSAAAAVELARDILDRLPRAAADRFTVMFGDPEAARLGEQTLSNSTIAVDPDHDGIIPGPVLIVGATQQQVTDVQEMLFGWRGGIAALLNAEWDVDQADADLTRFVKSFDYIYCYGPLEIKGMFSKKEGCVFKWVKKGSPGGTPWHILQREGGGDWQVVARQQRRPTPGDMEVAFYNAAAASSPITKGMKFVKGLTGGGNK